MKKAALVILLSLTAACGSPATKTAGRSAASSTSSTTAPAVGAAAAPESTTTVPSGEAAAETSGTTRPITGTQGGKKPTTTTTGPVSTTTTPPAGGDSTTTTTPAPSTLGNNTTTTTAKPATTTTTRPPTTTTTIGYTGPQFRCNETSKGGWECRGTTLKGEGGYWACWPDMGWKCAGETGNGFGAWAWSRISDTQWVGAGDTAAGPRVWDCKWNGSSGFKYWLCRQTDQNGTNVDGDLNSWMWAPGINTYKVEYKTANDLSCWDNNGWFCSEPKGAFSTHMMMPVPFPLVTFCPGQLSLPPPNWQGNPCG